MLMRLNRVEVILRTGYNKTDWNRLYLKAKK